MNKKKFLKLQKETITDVDLIPKEEAKTNLEKLLFHELVKELAEFYKNIPLLEKRKEEPKQEILEEYIREVTKNFKDEMSIKFTSSGIKLGVKWQQEQNKKLYSEEEVLEIIDLLFHRYASSFRIDAKEYFLQFKNKNNGRYKNNI